MTKDQENKCHAIIHTSAVAAAAGNVVPIPGLGIAADTTALTLMAISLAAVFGGDLSREAARALAFSAIKNAALRQPLRLIGKELSKLIPGVGSVVAPAVSLALLEAAGWSMAKDLAKKFG